MKALQRSKHLMQDWPYAIGILCVLGMGFNGCTKPAAVPPPPPPTPTPTVEKEIPPPDESQQVEAQLLETVETAEGLGEGNPLLLSSLYSLATFYEQQGEVEKAEDQYKRALSIKEKASGPEHPDIAIILNKYANLLRVAHRDEEADNLSKRASEIMAKNSPPPTKKIVFSQNRQRSLRVLAISGPLTKLQHEN